jgi:uncharacterized repeat protein (TIGR03803 family)
MTLRSNTDNGRSLIEPPHEIRSGKPGARAGRYHIPIRQVTHGPRASLEMVLADANYFIRFRAWRSARKLPGDASAERSHRHPRSLPPSTGHGNLYGTCYSGSANGTGTLFRITTKGVFTKMYDYAAEAAPGIGNLPRAGLIEASDGNLDASAPPESSGAWLSRIIGPNRSA